MYRSDDPPTKWLMKVRRVGRPVGFRTRLHIAIHLRGIGTLGLDVCSRRRVLSTFGLPFLFEFEASWWYSEEMSVLPVMVAAFAERYAGDRYLGPFYFVIFSSPLQSCAWLEIYCGKCSAAPLLHRRLRKPCEDGCRMPCMMDPSTYMYLV